MKTESKVRISVSSFKETDELYTYFYTCPSCLFERVPHGALDCPQFTAKHCPGCAAAIEWGKIGE